MAVEITVVKEDLETLFTRIELTGLTVGARYDVMRLQLRNLGKDDTGERVYERELPDRRALWSAVSHRVGWETPSATVQFRDYEGLRRPFRYFVVPSSSVGPYEYDFGDGRYPLTRGVLSDDIIHWNGDLADLDLDAVPDTGHVVVRSVHELAHYAECCVVEMDGPTYTARATEFAVMGSQYPVVVSDSREARRGAVTLMTRNLGQYNALRRVVFPESGRIRPFLLQASGDSAVMLLDDMRCIPLDVEIEQATHRDPDARYVRIEYVEVDNSAPLIGRSGDNDHLIDTPEANFTISDTTPARGQWITLTDTSTGLGDDWEWTVNAAQDNEVGVFYTEGPHRVRFPTRGQKAIKLRYGGSGAGYHTRTKTVEVH